MMRRKLLRTMLRYKAQFISMIIMIALGIGVFIGFNMEWVSLRMDTGKVFEETGFADFRIYSETGFSKADLEKVLAIDGVTDATRYLSVNTTVQGDTDVIALTVNENMNVSGLLLMAGEPYDPESQDGIWLSDQYAEQNGISIGDEMTLMYKLLSVRGQVKGLVKSSEYMICLPDESQLMPDFHSYGFAFISPVMLRKAIFMEFYSQIWGTASPPQRSRAPRWTRRWGEPALFLARKRPFPGQRRRGKLKRDKPWAPSCRCCLSQSLYLPW
mgnify:CR=1 FL=1